MIRRAIRSALTLLGDGERLSRLERAQPPLIDRAAWFIACEMVEGDYIEFGVYEGHAFKNAYHAIANAFTQRITQREGGASADQVVRRRAMFEKMRFVALDSFEGLPELNGIDQQTQDFRKGQYSASEAQFRENIARAGVPLDRVAIAPGWFAETSNAKTWKRLGVKKAAIIWIDGDLYSSARDALAGVADLLQDGTVLIFDDWFAFRGNPRRGEQRAFSEWRSTMTEFDFVEFHQEGVWRKSFIAVARNVAPVEP